MPLLLQILIDGEKVQRKDQTKEHFKDEAQTSVSDELLEADIQECCDSW